MTNWILEHYIWFRGPLIQVIAATDYYRLDALNNARPTLSKH